MIQDCLETLERGDVEDLFEIVPHIGVLRDPRFDDYLIAFLGDEDVKRREFAAYAMGAVGSRKFFDPLKGALSEAKAMRGAAAEELQTAILEAIGALGDDAAAEFFLPILEAPSDGRRSERVLRRRIVEALGAIAQQGGRRSLEVLLAMTRHEEPEIRAQAVSEIAVSYWHRPNEIPRETIEHLYECRNDGDREVADSALAALEGLADVGCRRAERLFTPRSKG